jgi:hypothetical protein
MHVRLYVYNCLDCNKAMAWGRSIRCAGRRALPAEKAELIDAWWAVARQDDWAEAFWDNQYVRVLSTEDQRAALFYVHSGRSLDRAAWVSFVRSSVWLCDCGLNPASLPLMSSSVFRLVWHPDVPGPCVSKYRLAITLAAVSAITTATITVIAVAARPTDHQVRKHLGRKHQVPGLRAALVAAGVAEAAATHVGPRRKRLKVHATPVTAVLAGVTTAVLESAAATDVAAVETPAALHEFDVAPSSMAELMRLAGFGFSFTEKATRTCRELDANAAAAHNDLAALRGPSQQTAGVATRLVGLEDAVAAANTTFDLMQLKQQVCRNARGYPCAHRLLR